MSEGDPREWRFCVGDMMRFAEKVVAYTSGSDRQAFVANEPVYGATLRNLELIGEAATLHRDHGRSRPLAYAARVAKGHLLTPPEKSQRPGSRTRRLSIPMR